MRLDAVAKLWFNEVMNVNIKYSKLITFFVAQEAQYHLLELANSAPDCLTGVIEAIPHAMEDPINSIYWEGGVQ